MLVIDEDRCLECGYCQTAITCPGEKNCTGCRACVKACPHEARHLITKESEIPTITCIIDGMKVQSLAKKTVLEVLKSLGYSITSFPEKDKIFAPCKSGGCFSCRMKAQRQGYMPRAWNIHLQGERLHGKVQ